MLVPQACATILARLSLVAMLAGCSTPSVERAWSECLAFGGSPKFMVTEGTRQAECQRF